MGKGETPENNVKNKLQAPYSVSHIVKDLFETKLKKCAYLKPISSHFFANYIIVFHKTEVQKIILRCLMGLNSN